MTTLHVSLDIGCNGTSAVTFIRIKINCLKQTLIFYAPVTPSNKSFICRSGLYSERSFKTNKGAGLGVAQTFK